MSGLKLGLCSVTFRALAYGEVLALAHETGVAGIEWGADVHVPAGDTSRARTVGDASRAHGIAVASYGSYVEAGASEPGVFERILETALALGAPNVRVWAGRRGVPSASVGMPDRERAVADLRAFAELAASASVSVSLEFHRETLTDTLASTLDLLARVDHRNLLTYWQPRPGIAGTEAADELHALRSVLSHLHVFHWNERRERLPLASSAAFWTPLLEWVAGWDDARVVPRWAMIEFVRGDAPDAFRDDVRALHDWLAATPRATA